MATYIGLKEVEEVPVVQEKKKTSKKTTEKPVEQEVAEQE